MKTVLKKDFIKFCEKFNIDWSKIEDGIVQDIYFEIDENDKKANKEFWTLIHKYGY